MIFIVESDRDCRLALAELLGMQGYAVVSADRAFDVLTMLSRQESRPTVILVDPVSPARRTRLNRTVHPEPIPSGSIDLRGIAEVSEEATIVGAVNYLRKPINPANLLSVLARLSERRSD